MSDTKVINVPDSGTNALPIWAMNNGGLFNGNGLGAGLVGFLIGAMINGGWGNGGLFGNNGNNNAAAAALGAQATANNNTDLLMTAITNTGERQREAIQTLSTMLGQDFNLVNGAVGTIQTSLATIAANQGMNTLQVINAIQSGNTALQNQLCSCCCQMQKETMEQGYQAQIRTLEQTTQLGSQADRNTNSVIAAINAQTIAMNDQFCALKEREMQAKINTQADIITQLRGQIDNANQTAQINAYVGSLIAPLQKQVADIAAKQPNTIPVTWPNVTAVNTTPYAGGMYGNGWNNGIYF